MTADLLLEGVRRIVAPHGLECQVLTNRHGTGLVRVCARLPGKAGWLIAKDFQRSLNLGAKVKRWLSLERTQGKLALLRAAREGRG